MIYIPRLCDDLWSYIGWGATYSVKWSIHNCCQAKIPQFQGFASILVLIDLKHINKHQSASKYLLFMFRKQILNFL